jgi:signal transduction histidine kinase
LPGPIELALYFVVAEALTNVARHSEATRATVRLERREGSAGVVVSDDGRGSADPRAGSGLQGLIDRVAAVDGQLTLESPPTGGTRLSATIPCAS